METSTLEQKGITVCTMMPICIIMYFLGMVQYQIYDYTLNTMIYFILFLTIIILVETQEPFFLIFYTLITGFVHSRWIVELSRNELFVIITSIIYYVYAIYKVKNRLCLLIILLFFVFHRLLYWSF